MDFPKTKEEKSVSESLDWVVLVSGIEMVFIRKGAFSIAKDIFLLQEKLTNVVSRLLLQLLILEPFSDPRQIGNQKVG